MSQLGDSPGALEAAQRALAVRDAELAAADRALAEVIGEAHALAVESIGPREPIGAEIDSAAVEAPRDSPATACELSRHLVDKNRDITAVVGEAKAAAHAKAVALKELTDRYR
jgi:hypothetical protein